MSQSGGESVRQCDGEPVTHQGDSEPVRCCGPVTITQRDSSLMNQTEFEFRWWKAVTHGQELIVGQ